MASYLVNITIAAGDLNPKLDILVTVRRIDRLDRHGVRLNCYGRLKVAAKCVLECFAWDDDARLDRVLQPSSDMGIKSGRGSSLHVILGQNGSKSDVCSLDGQSRIITKFRAVPKWLLSLSTSFRLHLHCSCR